MDVDTGVKVTAVYPILCRQDEDQFLSLSVVNPTPDFAVRLSVKLHGRKAQN